MSDDTDYTDPRDDPMRSAYDHVGRARRILEEDGPKTLKGFAVMVMLDISEGLLEDMGGDDD